MLGWLRNYLADITGQYFDCGKYKQGFTFQNPPQDQDRVLKVTSVESASLQGIGSNFGHHLPCGGERL